MSQTLDMRVNPFDPASPQPFIAKSQKTEIAEALKDPLVERVYNLYPHCRLSKLSICPMTVTQLDNLLQLIMIRHSRELVNSYHTGKFISSLMESSYKNSNNDFLLRTGDYSIKGLLSAQGRSENSRIRYTLIGNSGYSCDVRYCEGIHKEGYVAELCFQDSESSKIDVYGKTGDLIGLGSKYCDFSFHDDVGGNVCANSSSSTVTFYADTGERPGYGSVSTLFRAVRKDIFWKCVNSLGRGVDNRVQLIEPDGTVIKEVRL